MTNFTLKYFKPSEQIVCEESLYFFFQTINSLCCFGLFIFRKYDDQFLILAIYGPQGRQAELFFNVEYLF